MKRPPVSAFSPAPPPLPLNGSNMANATIIQHSDPAPPDFIANVMADSVILERSATGFVARSISAPSRAIAVKARGLAYDWQGRVTGGVVIGMVCYDGPRILCQVLDICFPATRMNDEMMEDGNDTSAALAGLLGVDALDVIFV